MSSGSWKLRQSRATASRRTLLPRFGDQMSRRMPLRVATLRITTSANSLAITMGPSVPPSVGYSEMSPVSGRSPAGPCGQPR